MNPDWRTWCMVEQCQDPADPADALRMCPRHWRQMSPGLQQEFLTSPPDSENWNALCRLTYSMFLARDFHRPLDFVSAFMLRAMEQQGKDIWIIPVAGADAMTARREIIQAMEAEGPAEEPIP